VVPVKGFPVVRQWYVVQLKGRRLPRVSQAFCEFLVEQGERLIRRHEAIRPGAGHNWRQG
jgi:hypothetical protein